MGLVGKEILIIDDDESLRMLLRKILETAGCRVSEAAGVRDALASVQTRYPDLIVLDLFMPEHDGFTFLKFRLQNKLLRSVPLLVLSGAIDREITQHALALGADQFLEKPLNAARVLQKIRYLFYSQQYYSYSFPAGQEAKAGAEVNGTVTQSGGDQLRVSASVRFDPGRPVELKIDSYLQRGGAPVVAKVANRRVEIKEGCYEQTVALAGQSREEKERFEKWIRQFQRLGAP